jgi:hypothetical protein
MICYLTQALQLFASVTSDLNLPGINPPVSVFSSSTEPASQTYKEKNAAPPSHGSLSGKRKRLQDLSEAISGMRQVNQSSARHGRRRF